MAYLTSDPGPPFVYVEGIANLRDIGGYPTSTGEPIRKGLVYRAADPSKATDVGLKKMGEDLGIRVIFDLRSSPEIRRDGPEWEGVKVDTAEHFADFGIRREWTPVFADNDYGPEQVALRYKDYTQKGTGGFVRAYRDIARAGTDAYGKVFRHLAQQNPEPCLIHCTAGKDRTGVLTAMLFMLAGVDPEIIAEEYSLTDKGLAELKPIFVERLLKNPTLDGDREGVINMISSKRENMAAAIEMIDAEFGGAEKYMRTNCKLNAEEIEQLRLNLIHTDQPAN